MFVALVLILIVLLLILAVLVTIAAVFEVILVSNVEIVFELTPPTLFTVVVKLPFQLVKSLTINHSVKWKLIPFW